MSRPIPIAPLRTRHPSQPRGERCPDHGIRRGPRDVCPHCEAEAMHRLRFASPTPDPP